MKHKYETPQGLPEQWEQKDLQPWLRLGFYFFQTYDTLSRALALKTTGETAHEYY